MAYTFNGVSKIITLTTGTTSVSVRDLWSRWVDWFLTSDNSKYLPAFEFIGGNDIDLSQGTYIPIYAFLMNGWKIKPQEANHTLTINDGILLVNGGGDPFNNTTGAYIVRINFQQPVQAISFSSQGGTSGPTAQQIREEIDNNSTQLQQILSDINNISVEGLTPEQALQLEELYRLQGLDVDNPMTVTRTSRIAGDIELEISGDGENTTTVTRQ